MIRQKVVPKGDIPGPLRESDRIAESDGIAKVTKRAILVILLDSVFPRSPTQAKVDQHFSARIARMTRIVTF